MKTAWDTMSPEAQDELEIHREGKRLATGRLTYDCFNLKVREDGRVACSKGRLLGQANDGSMDLTSILRGKTSGVCRACPDFDTEEEANA